MYWILLIFITCLQNMTIYVRRPTEIQDIGHNHMPVIRSRWKFVPDMLCLLTGAVAFYLYRTNPTVLFKALFYLFLLRWVSIHLTVLPPVKDFECTERHPMDCAQDYVFSGHMACVVLYTLFIYDKFPQWQVPLILTNVVQAWFILGLRNHYTIDVFVGTLVAWLVKSKLT
jgi:hypothetical protein